MDFSWIKNIAGKAAKATERNLPQIEQDAEVAADLLKQDPSLARMHAEDVQAARQADLNEAFPPLKESEAIDERLGVNQANPKSAKDSAEVLQPIAGERSDFGPEKPAFSSPDIATRAETVNQASSDKTQILAGNPNQYADEASQINQSKKIIPEKIPVDEANLRNIPSKEEQAVKDFRRKTAVATAGAIAIPASYYAYRDFMSGGNGSALTPKEATKKAQQPINPQDTSEDQTDDTSEAETQSEVNASDSAKEQQVSTPTDKKALEASSEVEPPNDKQKTKYDTKSEAEPIDLGPTEGYTQNLLAAQKARNDAVLANQLLKSSELIGTAISGAKPIAQGIFDQNIKEADNIVKQLQDRVENEKNDPNSSMSKSFQSYLEKSMGLKFKGAVPASTLATFAPMAAKKFQEEYNGNLQRELSDKVGERQEKIAALRTEAEKEAGKTQRAFLASEHEKDRDVKRELKELAVEQQKESQEQRTKDKVNKRFSDLGKRVEAAIASGRSGFGMDYKNWQSIENAQALLHGAKNLDDLDNREVVEVARVLDRTLSQGQSTISGTTKLTPETARTILAKQLEWVTNKRQGAQAGDFIKRTEQTLARESDLAKKRLKETKTRLFAPDKDLAKLDPDKWDTLLQQHQLPPDLFKDSEDQNSSEAPSNTKNANKTVIRKGYNPSTNQTQLVYSDGSKEIVEGRQ